MGRAARVLALSHGRRSRRTLTAGDESAAGAALAAAGHLRSRVLIPRASHSYYT